ncbi:hypothetical protein ABFS83_03G108600 [Erythranthe nasuta]
MKLMTMATLVLALLLVTTFAENGPAEAPSDISGFCKEKCAVRCSKAGRQNRCLQYCRICCAKCNCVPSGTYGNRDECPCYRDWKNPEGGPKCP